MAKTNENSSALRVVIYDDSVPNGGQPLGSAANPINTVAAGGGSIVSLAQPAAVSGNLTSASGGGSVVQATVTNYPMSAVSIQGTYNLSIRFEVSDDAGVTWYAINGTRVSSTTPEGAIALPLVNTARTWQLLTAGFTTLRVLCTAYTSGTGAIRISPVSAAAGGGGGSGGGLVQIDQATPGTTNAVQLSGPMLALVAGAAKVGQFAVDQTTPGTTNLVQIGGASQPPMSAGSAVIGKVSIDQATPGTTNLVQIGGSLPAGVAVIGKTSIDQTTPGTTNLVQIGGTLPALTTGSAIVGKVGIDQTTPGTTNLVQIGGTGQPPMTAGGAIIGKVGIDQTTPGTTNLVQVGGTLPALSAGSAVVGKVGIDQTTPGTTNLVQVGGSLPAGAAVIGKASIDQTTPGTTNLVQIGGASQPPMTAGSAVIGKVSVDQTTPGTTNLVQIGGASQPPMTAGSAVIGKVSIDQTTPGTTNFVAANLTQINGSATAIGVAGQLQVAMFGSQAAVGDTPFLVINALADAVSNAGGLSWQMVNNYACIFNGTTWDRQRGNVAVTALASAGRTATTSSATQINYNHRGILIFMNVTAVSGAPVLTPKLQVVGPVSAASLDWWIAGAALATTGERTYLLYPGAATASSGTATVQTAIPRSFVITVTHGTADSVTYSVSYALIV